MSPRHARQPSRRTPSRARGRGAPAAPPPPVPAEPATASTVPGPPTPLADAPAPAVTTPTPPAAREAPTGPVVPPASAAASTVVAGALTDTIAPQQPAPSAASSQAPAPTVLRTAPTAAPITPGGSVVPGGVIPSRAERRAQVRQRSRRLWLRVLAGALAAVVLLGAVVFLLVRGGGGTTPSTQPARTQKTLAMTISPMHAGSLTSALLATDPKTSSGAVVLVPSRLLLDSAGAGAVYFGTTPTLGKNAPAQALSNALGVTVDGSWSLTPTGLAKLVDDVGGVDVTVDTNVVVRKPNGQRTVLVTAGPQHLKGAGAAVYATYLAPGQPEEARLARFNQVLQQVLLGLPTKAAEVAPLVDHLGADSRATVSNTDLSAFLASLATVTQADGTVFQNIPVTKVDLPGAGSSYTLDVAGASTMVDSLLADSKPTGPATGKVRVLVQNGVGTPGLGADAYQKLHAAGFAFIPGGNANHFGYQTTLVLIPNGSAGAIANGRAVAKALGVPAGSLRIDTQGQTVADVVVVLGKDFKP